MIETVFESVSIDPRGDLLKYMILQSLYNKIRIFPVVSATGFRFGRESEGNLRFPSHAAILLV